ncbi:hypothetical protein [Kitasatospora sp. NPDC093806]|uniref:hypothetical protein n=1 Tax=Kitasatospora sp. NPDC093806 TaxID=3155075 RepID=UPI003437B623
MMSITAGRSTRALVVLAAVGALTLSACNDDSSSDTAKTPPPAAPTAAATTAPPAATSAPAAPSTPAATSAAPSAPATPAAPSAPPAGGATAAPGTTFKIGEAAQVPFTFGSTKGTVSLAVTSIQAGDPADLDPLKLGDKVKGMVPFYIRYTITNSGTTDLSNTSVDHIKGLLPDGSLAQEVSVIGEFAKCSSASLPRGFVPGQTAERCALAVAPNASVKVTGAQYWGSPYGQGKTGLNWK